ncbi:MAG: excinuclease ABC subunit C [Bacteroidales bacterium]|nr:excinuclease ABC subunit C [Bacteroidales bacterium]HOY38072.1 excinuclease ABC subunit UvrC [Bacteroidales bacterium]HQP03602.1 excinuclease ABC subunit UvrC [Bacteroidales bacterium]
MVTNEIKNEIASLPAKPGVYKFIDSSGTIIYIGKAKNLKKRVSSYFNKTQENNKTRILVNKIAGIQHTVVDNESEALLLENNLIKQWQPRYNLLLKDDKTYPWICITGELFPRIFYTRTKEGAKNEYFGPYASVHTVKTLLQLIRQLYKIRTCRLLLNQDSIQNGRFQVCLEYHIGNCNAPCVGLQTEKAYSEDIKLARDIIKGNLQRVTDYLKNQMLDFAKDYKFEEANSIKQKIAIIESYKAKSTVVSNKIKRIDVYGLAEDKDSVYISFLKIVDGAVVHSHNAEMRAKFGETKQELLVSYAFEMWSNSGEKAPEAVVPFLPEFKIEGLTWTVPRQGDKFKLLELAGRNAKIYMLERHRIIEKKDPEIAIERKLKALQLDLHLREIPDYFECFDNSNFQGSNPVASCVVFRNAKPSKKEYRHFNIKTVEGPDDFASMQEIVFRRYKRIMDQNEELPKLIIVDGGKGQLSAAVEILKKLGVYGKLAVIGIAKRLEEIYFPEDSVPAYLDKNSESLRLIRFARDEAHRFAVSFHRKKRSSEFLISEFEQIQGIGEKSILLLIDKFKSLSEVKKANQEDIISLVGKSKAEKIASYFAMKK